MYLTCFIPHLLGDEKQDEKSQGPWPCVSCSSIFYLTDLEGVVQLLSAAGTSTALLHRVLRGGEEMVIPDKTCLLPTTCVELPGKVPLLCMPPSADNTNEVFLRGILGRGFLSKCWDNFTSDFK